METTYQIPFANLQIFQRHTITFANTYVAIWKKVVLRIPHQSKCNLYQL
jgi:hypothetical protein